MKHYVWGLAEIIQVIWFICVTILLTEAYFEFGSEKMYAKLKWLDSSCHC